MGLAEMRLYPPPKNQCAKCKIKEFVAALRQFHNFYFLFLVFHFGLCGFEKFGLKPQPRWLSFRTVVFFLHSPINSFLENLTAGYVPTMPKLRDSGLSVGGCKTIDSQVEKLCLGKERWQIVYS